jgi:hypothetical protein
VCACEGEDRKLHEVISDLYSSHDRIQWQAVASTVKKLEVP